MIQAVIFDMDGVLFDAEPLWREAKKSVLATVGITMTDDLLRQTMGIRIDEVVDYLYNKFLWEGPTKKQVTDLISEKAVKLIKTEGEAMEGVIECLNLIKKQNLRLALASVVTMNIINTILNKLKIQDYFEIIYSAEFEEYGKPHPAVYITTAKKLNIQPQSCVCIEDSINGIIAVKAAKMKCIAIPSKELMGDKRLGIADIVLPSLLKINEDTFRQLGK